MEKTLPFTKEQIISAAGIHPLKVRNIYVYGSQVYRTASTNSDYDIVVVSGHILAHEEKRATVDGVLLNIHIITPDKFIEDLKRHDIMNLECVFAPKWAILQEKLIFDKEFILKRLIKNNLAQSYSSWKGGKMKIQDYNIHKGVKSIFHALRMLMFAIQIAEHGRIVDYSVGNALYKEIMELDEFEWDVFREKYLPLKMELEEKLKSFATDEK